MLQLVHLSGIVHGGVVLFLAKLHHQPIVEWFAIISYDIPRDTIPIDQVSSNEIDHRFFLHFPKGHNFHPLREVISCGQDVQMATE